MTLYDLIPRDNGVGNDVLLDCFLEYVTSRKLQLYPAQEAAVLELFEEKNVILNTPTGSGKSLVAAALHFKALAQGKRSIYTCPIKALVNEKWLALCREFGPDNVGLSTGDASVNRDAPILCCTAEILANIALREGAQADVQDVVMDEFHYYSDRDRGVAWQVPLLTLSKTRFLLMSATLGDTAFFEEELTKLNGLPSVTVHSTNRPVPLEFRYSDLPLAKTLETLAAEGKSPVYVVHFTQLDAAQSAQDFTSINVCTKEEKAAIAQALEGFKFNSPYGPDLKKWLRHGIGLHHAGLLPKYRVLVEQLAQQGLLKVICGTDTLGVGINVPIRTVLFSRLCKYDGQKTGILSARDFHQIGGRAGRKGFDDLGWVVAQAPEHVIENLKLEEKSARDGKKVVKRKPPEKNFVNWDKQTFARLISASPEKLSSKFQVTHGMLLNVLSRKGTNLDTVSKKVSEDLEGRARHSETVSKPFTFHPLPMRNEWGEDRGEGNSEQKHASSPRPSPPSDGGEGESIASSGVSKLDLGAHGVTRPTTTMSRYANRQGDGCRAMRELIARSHESPNAKKSHVKRAWQLFRSLVDRKIIEIIPETEEGVYLRVNVDLQDDFSMDQVLSLYLVETVPLLDSQSPDYALDLITLVESILEDPDIILRKQLDRVKDRKMAEMKMEGVEYQERMDELEKLEYPKPLREFIYSTFNAFADRHPWVGQENIRPKSIAREMFEQFRSFADYIKDYELQRAEGLLLRHLSRVHKVLTQTVPDAAKNDAAREMEIYLETMLLQVDSSLLDEWKKMRDPNFQQVAEKHELRPPGAEEAAADITRDTKAFTAAVRNRIFTFLRNIVIGDYEQALTTLNSLEQSAGEPWTPDRLQKILEEYYVEHQYICLDPNARNLRNTYVVASEDKRSWRVQQVLIDPDEHNDWMAEFEVDLLASKAAKEPIIKLTKIGTVAPR